MKKVCMCLMLELGRAFACVSCWNWGDPLHVSHAETGETLCMCLMLELGRHFACSEYELSLCAIGSASAWKCRWMAHALPRMYGNFAPHLYSGATCFAADPRPGHSQFRIHALRKVQGETKVMYHLSNTFICTGWDKHNNYTCCWCMCT
jgi:hypothetical protein